jgi:hypothetical protein
MSAEPLQTHADLLRASGVFDRSGRMRRLFDYLLDCTSKGKIPKEIDIALEALDRDSTFDVTQDAAVRVYIYKLRRLLDSYYARVGSDQHERIVVAKGEYRLALEPIPSAMTETAPPGSGGQPGTDPRRQKHPRRRGLLAALAVSLLLNGLLATREFQGTTATDTTAASWQNHPVWSPILHDNLPVILVLGDYYIFGETDGADGIQRMVREFNINSRTDLEQYAQTHPEVAERYMDLDLTYLPTSIGPALRNLLPMLASQHKRIQVIPRSELTTSMLTSADIIYVGYLSALGSLHQVVFSGSSFEVGDTYDELVSSPDHQHYLSQAADPRRGNQKYRDYGYLSTFPGPNGNRIIIIAGTRDAAVAGVAESLTQPAGAAQLAQESKAAANFEALYEVYGVGNTNVGTKLLRANSLNSNAIWRN